MSRSTQYIGLNGNSVKLVNDMLLTKKYNGRSTPGMFGEEVPLADYEAADGTLVFLEIVQAEPWSSGPMIFTCLLSEEGVNRVHEWVEDNSVDGEVDYANGKYYV